MIGIKPTPYTPKRHLHTRALDTAWHRYHDGAIQWGAARNDMMAAGVSMAEAERLLESSDRPSLAFVLPKRKP